MSSPYRHVAAALRERRAGLVRALADVDAQMERLARERSLLVLSLDGVDERLEKARAPLHLRIASPCSVSWDSMNGDERVRMCAECKQNVYDLSALTEVEASELLASKGEGGACVRFYRRRDGRVMTADCPVGKRRARRRLAVAALGAAAVTATVGIARLPVHPTDPISRVRPEGAAAAEGWMQGYVMKSAEDAGTD